MTDPRRRIPGIDRLLASPECGPLLEVHTAERVTAYLRKAVAEVRERLGEGDPPPDLERPGLYVEWAAAALAADEVPSLVRVINATGVVLHTNLGRAPLARAALEAVDRVGRGYANLEFDLDEGVRGSRYEHCAELLRELTGADAGLVVNNCAAALALAMNTLAGGRRGVVVSRGELVEIGGGFRIPEMLDRAGAALVEVGSTNRTRLADYRGAAVGCDAGALLKVHRSNFRISGFTEEAVLAELAELGAELGVPVVHDLGSGLLMDPARLGLPEEPRPPQSLAAGADLVVFSGDKLLGGPQAGVVVGRADLIERMRRNPLCRALRVDKGTLAALEATLRLYRDPDRALAEIPVLRMLATPVDALESRARALAARAGDAGVRVTVETSAGAVGGGTYPGVEIPSRSLGLEGSVPRPDDLARRLRDGSPAVVGRREEGRLLLDLRTVDPAEDEALLERLIASAGAREQR